MTSPGHLALHQFSRFNRAWVEASEQCGCFYCCRFFSPTRITRWVDQGKTATCPDCSLDAVLPEKGLNRPLTQEILEGMNQAFFFTHVSVGALREALEGPGPWKALPGPSHEQTLQRLAQLTEVAQALEVEGLISDQQLRKDLIAAFPWGHSTALVLGWVALLSVPFVVMGLPPHPWAIALAYVASMIVASSLCWASMGLWPSWRSWAKAWEAWRQGKLNHPELGKVLMGVEGVDFTPKTPDDLCYREVEDWVRALPDLQPFWDDWKNSGKPLRQCDLQRFLACARNFAGPAGPYQMGDPL